MKKIAIEQPWQLKVFNVSVRKKTKWHWAKPHVQEYLNINTKAKCLDVGAGVGTLSILMEQIGGSWQFTETDSAAAEETRKIVNGQVREVDIDNEALQPGSYDLITVFDVIEHVTEPEKFMVRLAKLLKSNGRLILTTPADDGGWYFWRRLADSWFGIDKAAHGHVVEGFSKEKLKKLTKQAGLDFRKLDPFSFFFTEAVELALNAAYIMKNRIKQSSTPGYNLALSPSSPADIKKHNWQLRVLQVVYPVLRAISLFDNILPVKRGYEWGLVATKGEPHLPSP